MKPIVTPPLHQCQLVCIVSLYIYDSFIATALSNAMPDFMQKKKSITRPGKTTKRAKQSSAARPHSPDLPSVLDVNTLRHKANSDWSSSLDPGISCGGKKGKGLMVAQQRQADVTLVCFSFSLYIWSTIGRFPNNIFSMP